MLLTYLIPMGVIAFVAASLLGLLCRGKRFRTNRAKAFRLFLSRFFGIWYALAAIALLFKITGFTMGAQGNPFAVNFVPFQTLMEYIGKRNWVQLAGNLLVLFPFPLLLYFNFPKMHCRGHLLTILCVTALIEPVQLLINVVANAPANVIDIDDFLLNAAGCLLGLSALKRIRRMTGA